MLYVNYKYLSKAGGKKGKKNIWGNNGWILPNMLDKIEINESVLRERKEGGRERRKGKREGRKKRTKKKRKGKEGRKERKKETKVFL